MAAKTLPSKFDDIRESLLDYLKSDDSFGIDHCRPTYDFFKYYRLDSGFPWELHNIAPFFKNCAQFFEAINVASSKFKFSDTQKDDWGKYYILLNNDNLKRRKLFGDLRIINVDSRIDGWMELQAKQIRNIYGKQKETVFILGNKGGGKSSFVKYLMKYRPNYWALNKIVPSRLEYSKLQDLLRDEPSELTDQIRIKLIRKKLVDNFFRDALEYAIFPRSSSESMLGVAPELAVINIYNNICEQYEGCLLPANHDEINKLLLYPSMTRTDKKNYIKQTSVFTKELVIKTLFDLDVRFLAIFDGFDYISATDLYLCSDKSELISSVAEMCFHKDKSNIFTSIVGTFDYSEWIVCRTETYNRFTHNTGHVHGRSKSRGYMIIPPSHIDYQRTIIKRGVDFLTANIKEAEDLLKTFKIITTEVTLTVSSSTGLDSSTLFEKLFNGNLRNHQCFFRDAVCIILYLLHKDNFDRDQDALSTISLKTLLVRLKDKDLTAMLKQYQYKFIEALVCRNDKNIINRVSVNANCNELHVSKVFSDCKTIDCTSRKNCALAFMSEPQLSGGFIDNIYNYHAYQSDLSTILEKPRILKVLTICQKPLNEEEIVGVLKDIYNYEPSNIGLTLALLCKTGFAQTELSDDYKLRYSITDRGSVVLNKLMFNNNYIERYFMKTLLHSEIVQELHKSINKIKGGEQFVWVIYSITAYYVLLRYVQLSEKSNSVTGDEYIFFDKLLKNLVLRVQKIVDNDSFKETDRSFAINALKAIQCLQLPNMPFLASKNGTTISTSENDGHRSVEGPLYVTKSTNN